MLVIPAIDLKDGRCVRLFQGDYAQVTVFSDHPAAIAGKWQDEGAAWLHVVDLDGAAAGQLVNLEVIEEILRSVNIPVEVGGGLRTFESLDRLVDVGVSRLILGTAAVEDANFLFEAARRWPGKIAVAIDARNGRVATRGWQSVTTVSATALAENASQAGVARLIYTDIERDGTMTEPNYSATAEIVASVAVPIIASGGVSRLDQLEKLQAVGVEGAIVGRALYNGAFSLRDALALFASSG